MDEHLKFNGDNKLTTVDESFSVNQSVVSKALIDVKRITKIKFSHDCIVVMYRVEKVQGDLP